MWLCLKVYMFMRVEEYTFVYIYVCVCVCTHKCDNKDTKKYYYSHTNIYACIHLLYMNIDLSYVIYIMVRMVEHCWLHWRYWFASYLRNAHLNYFRFDIPLCLVITSL